MIVASAENKVVWSLWDRTCAQWHTETNGELVKDLMALLYLLVQVSDAYLPLPQEDNTLLSKGSIPSLGFVPVNQVYMGYIFDGLKRTFAKAGRLTDPAGVLDKLNSVFSGKMRQASSLSQAEVTALLIRNGVDEDTFGIGQWVAVAYSGFRNDVDSMVTDAHSVFFYSISPFGEITKLDYAGPLKTYAPMRIETKSSSQPSPMCSLITSLAQNLLHDPNCDFIGDLMISRFFAKLSVPVRCDDGGAVVRGILISTYLDRLRMADYVYGVNYPVGSLARAYGQFVFGNDRWNSVLGITWFMTFIRKLATMVPEGKSLFDKGVYAFLAYNDDGVRSSRDAVDTPSLPLSSVLGMEAQQPPNPDEEDDSADGDAPDRADAATAQSDGDDPDDDDEGDPATDTNGYDPSNPPPAMPASSPSVGASADQNTIDLISFDKTGEGVSEGLYRRAVLALNTKVQSDDSFPVTPEVRADLAYLVNGYLYRTSISTIKGQMSYLGLDKFLKPVTSRGK